MMTPSSLFSALAASIQEGNSPPSHVDEYVGSPAVTKSFNSVMAEVNRNGSQYPSGQAQPAGSGDSPAAASTIPIQPNVAADTLTIVMTRPQAPASGNHKPVSAQSVNSKNAPVGQTSEARRQEKSTGRNASARETPNLPDAPQDLALSDLIAHVQAVTQPSNSKLAPPDQRGDPRSSDEILAEGVSSKDAARPITDPPGKTVDADFFLSNMLMPMLVPQQIAAAQTGKLVTAKSTIVKKVSNGGEAPAESPPAADSKLESKMLLAKTRDPHLLETSGTTKGLTAQSAKSAEADVQPVVAGDVCTPPVVSQSASSSDGIGGALSSNGMISQGEKNEITASAKQSVPTPSPQDDLSLKPVSEAALGFNSEHFGPKQDLPDSALMMDWSSKSAGWNFDAGIGVVDSAFVGHSAVQTERFGQMVDQQVAMMRQSGANNVAVSLKIDPQTELSLQLTNHNGQIEAAVRLERGAATELDSHWKDLQESLARVDVQLLPLEIRVSNRTNGPSTASDAASGSLFDQQSQNPQRHSREARQDLPPASVAVTSASAKKTTTRTISRQGWESWA